MSDPEGAYTYLCSAGKKRAQVLYFSGGTPSSHARDPRATIETAVVEPSIDGTTDPITNTEVEGSLFTARLEPTSGRGGVKCVVWMIDPRYANPKEAPRKGTVVGWAVTYLTNKQTPSDFNCVPVWASDNAPMGRNAGQDRYRLYYFQNNWPNGRPKL